MPYRARALEDGEGLGLGEVTVARWAARPRWQQGVHLERRAAVVAAGGPDGDGLPGGEVEDRRRCVGAGHRGFLVVGSVTGEQPRTRSRVTRGPPACTRSSSRGGPPRSASHASGSAGSTGTPVADLGGIDAVQVAQEPQEVGVSFT